MHSDSTNPTAANQDMGNSDSSSSEATASFDPSFDRRLDAVLASLPREEASEGFAEAVLERLGHRRTVRRQWQALAAAALVILTIGLGSFQWQRHQEQLAAVERMALLNAEYQVLQAEFEALEATRERARPLIYLGSANDDVELVLDLWKLASASQASAGSGGGGSSPKVGDDASATVGQASTGGTGGAAKAKSFL